MEIKKHYKYSKTTHLIVLLTFFLPFFYTGCEDSNAQVEETSADSLSVISDTIQPSENETAIYDTFQKTIPKVDTTKEISESQQTDTSAEKTKESESISKNICEKYPYLSPILVPKEDTYTGLALIIDSIYFALFSGVLFSFILLLISLIIKFIETGARRSIVLTELISLLFLSFSHPYSLSADRLWGFWVCLAMMIILFVYDIIIVRLGKQMPKKFEI